MVKKAAKTVVYTPISQDIPNAQSQNLSVPDYEDRGIQYKGYAKIPIGGGEFRLKKQETRFYANVFDSSNGNSLTVSRPNKSTHIFYCTSIVMTWRIGQTFQAITFYDGNSNNPKYKYLLPYNTNSSIQIELTNCPRKFTDDIIYIPTFAFTGADHVLITLTGFDEEI